MIKTTAINNDSDFIVIWDTGKRCNFDCTYCSSNRHTNDSPHSSLESLLSTYDFVKHWAKIYDKYTVNPRNRFTIDFTGGEPTSNPNFWELLKHIKNDDSNIFLGVTTNGSWGEKYVNLLIEHVKHATISVHFEEDNIVKKRVLNNILTLNQHMPISVNVMLHTDYWDEMKQTVEILEKNNVKFNLVPIGDSADDIKGWFTDKRGILRRTAQEYTKEQQEWFFSRKGISPDKIPDALLGSKLGRSCCGGRCMTGKVDGTWQPVKFINTEFNNWYCMVDWFFLHIDQELGQVLHHQTCKALRGQQTGVIGYLDDSEQLLINLENMLSNGNVEPIICPNKRCGCGMCVPKAQDFTDFVELWNQRANVSIQEKSV